MLPASKRRGERAEGGNLESEDVAFAPTEVADSSRRRPPLPSMSDEAPTSIYASPAVSAALERIRGATPRPAAGSPPPPPSSVRAVGRTPGSGVSAPRGPKIVKRAALSPAELIKATLEAAQSGRGPAAHPADHDSERTKILRASEPPPSSDPNRFAPFSDRAGMAPWSAPPPSGPISSASTSIPAVAVPASTPAHFMVPQVPYSDVHIPVASSRAGRSTLSWAAVVLGVGVVLGASAFGVMRGGKLEALSAIASFVDPSRVPGGPSAVAAAPADPVTVAVPIVSAPVVMMPAASPVVAPAAEVPAAAAPAAAATPVAAAASPVMAQPEAAAAKGTPQTVAAGPAAPARVAPPAPAPRAVSRPAPEPVAAAPVVKPAPPRAKPVVSAAPVKPSSDVDDEQRKALKALQESQLESTF